jgi:hypothetical protein
MAGLLGIAQSKSLWATNFLNLKDTSEYFYAWGAPETRPKASLRRASSGSSGRQFQPDTYAATVTAKFRAGAAELGGTARCMWCRLREHKLQTMKRAAF